MLALRKPMHSSSLISATPVQKELLCLLLLVAVTAITSVIRVHLLSVPLERDEGEYAYIGQLVLQGVTPFQEAYNMKMPGIYGIYALMMALFGKSIEGIHAGLLIANLVTVFLLFLLGRRMFSSLVGCVAGASFATMSLSPSVLGPFAHAEHFVLPPVLLGLVILYDALPSRKRSGIFIAGTLMGLGFIVLQLGAPFVAFGVCYLLYFARIEQGLSWRSVGARVALFAAGAAVPFSLVCLTMLLDGVFGVFWFWTFQYALEYVSRIDLGTGLLYLHGTTSEIVESLWVPWTFALIGLISVLGKRLSQNAKFFCLIFFVTSFLATCPGFFFRQHYFVLLLPAIALLCGVGVETVFSTILIWCPRWAGSPAFVGLVLLATLSSVPQERPLLLMKPTAAVSRLIFSPNPFVESIEIARYIRERTSPDERIAILGSEPQIYFYAQRLAATGYLYTYPLMENQKFARVMQEQMIRQIEAASPRYLVFVNIPFSWLVRPESDTLILNWFNRYQLQYYNVVGVIDILSSDESVIRWDRDANGYIPRSTCWLKVYRRIHNAGPGEGDRR